MADADRPQGYKRLKIYQVAHSLGVRVHALTMRLPRFELYEEGSQARRSSKRVSASIVEGYRQRKYRAEFIRYLYRALGSSDETLEHLEYLLETGSADGHSDVTGYIASYKSLSGQLASFIRGVERFHSTPESVGRPPTIHNPQSTI
ncbi:MAG TPA: four helix bundle protein [Planctomycetota bacterium]|nr:four helix bundle protein [Planctomycetota bacterium]